jgi:hypothetical protein
MEEIAISPSAGEFGVLDSLFHYFRGHQTRSRHGADTLQEFPVSATPRPPSEKRSRRRHSPSLAPFCIVFLGCLSTLWVRPTTHCRRRQLLITQTTNNKHGLICLGLAPQIFHLVKNVPQDGE